MREQVEAGGLMSYGGSLVGVARRVAGYVDKLFKGAKAADLPVEQPTTLELVINLKTAKALGLTIPPSLLLQADALIQPSPEPGARALNQSAVRRLAKPAPRPLQQGHAARSS
jgi:hypothetical protein